MKLVSGHVATTGLATVYNGSRVQSRIGPLQLRLVYCSSAWIDCAVRTNRSDPRARAAALARPVRACFQPSAACRVSGAERASGLPPWSKARREG